MRFLVCLSLISLLSLTAACSKSSTANNEPASESQDASYINQPPEESVGGVVGNGGSVVDLPEGVALADSYYEAPDYKVPEFYYGRVEDFNKAFPGVEQEIHDIISILNWRYGGVEVLRFDPQEFEIYLTEKFSGDHAMPVEKGLESRQVAYTFSFRSLTGDLTGEAVHNVIEISPEIKSWSVRMQALAILHEAAHHQPRLGFEEHYHSVIAPMIEGAETAMKIRDRQRQARLEGRLDLLQAGELEKLQILDRALFYMIKGRVSRGPLEYIPLYCDSPYSFECQAASGVQSQPGVRILDPKGGGIVILPMEQGYKVNGESLYSYDFTDWSGNKKSGWKPRPDQEDNIVRAAAREQFAAAVVAKVASNYASVDSYVELTRTLFPEKRPKESTNRQVIEAYNQRRDDWTWMYWQNFSGNRFEDAKVALELNGSACKKNVFRDISHGVREGWKALKSFYRADGEGAYRISCFGASGNTVEDFHPSGGYYSFKRMFLLGQNNTLKSVTIRFPAIVSGNGARLENVSISPGLYGLDGNAVGRLVIDSGFVAKNSILTGSSLVRASRNLWGEVPGQNSKEMVFDSSMNFEDVVYLAYDNSSRKLSELTDLPAHRLSLVVTAFVQKLPDETRIINLRPWFLSDLSKGPACDTSAIGMNIFLPGRRDYDESMRKFREQVVPCMDHQFVPLSSVIGTPGK